jgi:hypothetical protein
MPSRVAQKNSGKSEPNKSFHNFSGKFLSGKDPFPKLRFESSKDKGLKLDRI